MACIIGSTLHALHKYALNESFQEAGLVYMDAIPWDNEVFDQVLFMDGGVIHLVMKAMHNHREDEFVPRAAAHTLERMGQLNGKVSDFVSSFIIRTNTTNAEVEMNKALAMLRTLNQGDPP